MAICSYCLKEKGTVNRYQFDDMCAECTNLALNSERVSKEAERINKILKEKRV